MKQTPKEPVEASGSGIADVPLPAFHCTRSKVILMVDACATRSQLDLRRISEAGYFHRDYDEFIKWVDNKCA